MSAQSTFASGSTASAAPWRAGVESARRAAWPGAVLVALAATVVVTYYTVPAMRATLDDLAAFRERWGFAYSAVATSLAAGVLPFLYLRLHPLTRATHPWSHGVFFTLFWAYKGVEVDVLYRLQAAVFGDQCSVATVGAKMLVDQLIYNGLFAAPIAVLVYGWKDAGFRWGPPLADWRAPRWYARRVLPVMIAVWGVWVPGVCCIYALPLALQLPLNSFVNCFWVILFSLITARTARD